MAGTGGLRMHALSVMCVYCGPPSAVDRDGGLIVALWWVGNFVLLLVVAPVVILLANRLIRPTLEIRAYADDVLEHGVALTATLDSVPKLVKTLELTGAARQLVGRYGAALSRLTQGDEARGRARSEPISARRSPQGNGGR